MSIVPSNSRSSTSFDFKLSYLSCLNSNGLAVYSDPCRINGLMWRIMVWKKEPYPTPPTLGIFLQCEHELGKSKTWSCFVKATLSLLSTIPDLDNLSRSFEHTFDTHQEDWGYSRFISWDDVTDVFLGYSQNDSITIRAYIEADLPFGIKIGERALEKVPETVDKVEETKTDTLPVIVEAKNVESSASTAKETDNEKQKSLEAELCQLKEDLANEKLKSEKLSDELEAKNLELEENRLTIEDLQSKIMNYNDSTFNASGSLRCAVDKFSEMILCQTFCSKLFTVGKFSWRIIVEKRKLKKSDRSSFIAYIKCDANEESSSWSCLANVTLKIVSQKKGIPDKTFAPLKHIFRPTDCWRFGDMHWDYVLREENGYIVDDRVVLHADLDGTFSLDESPNINPNTNNDEKSTEESEVDEISENKKKIESLEVELSKLKTDLSNEKSNTEKISKELKMEVAEFKSLRSTMQEKIVSLEELLRTEKLETDRKLKDFSDQFEKEKLIVQAYKEIFQKILP